ncbi:hypothetical protein KLNKPBOH_01278 [Aeromonas veronii]
MSQQSIEIPLVEGLDAGHLLIAPSLAREDFDGVGAHRIDLVDHLGARPLTKSDHAHHGGDADDDAEHGEEGAHPVGEHGMHRHPSRFPIAIPVVTHGAFSGHYFLMGCGGGWSQHGRLAGAAILFNPTICESDDSVGMAGHVHIVGDQNDGMALSVQLLEDRYHLLAALAIQCACRFIGEDYFAAIGQRPGDTDPLLLTAGELTRGMVAAIGQPESAQ